MNKLDNWGSWEGMLIIIVLTIVFWTTYFILMTKEDIVHKAINISEVYNLKV